MDWATKRKVTILSIIAALVFVVSSFALFSLLYNQPTCFDGIQNKNETGVDCGGVCNAVCPDDASQPIVLWERAFLAAEGRYNLVAYIENPNSSSRASSVGYEFKVYDRDNVLIEAVQGTTSIPPNQLLAVFEGPISLDREPARVTFRFVDTVSWVSVEERGENPINISNRTFSALETRPRVQAEFTNTTIEPVSNIEAIAIVYDSANVAIGASRTIIDRLERGETTRRTFTWPQPFETGVDVCQQPADTMLVIDRSGSMQFDSEDPPQPLTDVKASANSFLDKLTDTDKAGVVSFATEASNPIDQPLTASLEDVKQTIDSIVIEQPWQEQHTNIADGLLKALEELNSDRRTPDTAGVIVLLSDGVATRPLPPARSGLDREEYPKQQAFDAAQRVADEGVALYVIGLGDEASGDFLKDLAPSPEHHFFAPSTGQLDQIYQDVATSICDRGVAVVRILTRILTN
ncbi:MAG: vWA domain-containing protein [Candidatus Paceibacterota bacterium]